jgi:PAS domain S-box-containing protein
MGDRTDGEHSQILSIFESIDEPIYVTDPVTSDVLYANQACRREFGEVTGKKCFEAFQDLDRPCPACTNDLIFGENLGKTHHREILHPKNRRWYRGIARAIRWPDGRMVRYEMGIDITDLKLVEAALQESERRYRSLVENVPDIIYSLDHEGRLTSVSEGGIALLGYTKDQLIGHHFSEFVSPDDLDLTLGAFKTALRNGRQGPRGLTFRLMRRDGGPLWVSLNSNMVFDENGTFLEEHGVARDITAQKEAEEERQRYEAQFLHTQKLESLGVLAGGIAHDFNNLLMGILGNVEIALKLLPADSMARKHLVNIKQVSRRAADLAGQMLAYSGRGQREVKHVDMSDIVREMTHLLEVSMSKKVTLEFDLEDDLPAVEADPSQLRQVVMNLITNASEAVGDTAGTIVISTCIVVRLPDEGVVCLAEEARNTGSLVRLQVTDTGHGMDEATIGRIFDPFFTTKFTGRGLGLAAVHGIILKHGGALAVASQLGRGTTFQVYLPTVDAPVDEEEQSLEVPSRPERRQTILVVDDEESVRAAVRHMLEFVGYTVITASEGAEALRLYREHAAKISAVVLDLTMPRMSGGEVLHELREINPDVKVLLSSGYDVSDVAKQLKDEESVAFIQKPYRMSQLHEKVQRLLEGS